MSDSDDTDILLVIPPDFFVTSAEEKLRKQRDLQQEQQQLQYFCAAPAATTTKDFLNDTISSALRDFDYNDYNDHWQPVQQRHILEMDSVDVDAVAMPPPPSTTAAYQFLPPRQKVELNHINARLSSFEQDHFATPPSDISTISNCTVRTQQQGKAYKVQRESAGLIHSTPKCPPYRDKEDAVVATAADNGVLHEIDHFLEDRHNYGGQWHPSHAKHHSDDYRYCQEQQQQPQTQLHASKSTSSLTKEQHASSLPSALNRLSLEQQFNNCNEFKSSVAAPAPADHVNLISLSEIWGKNGGAAVGATAPNLSLKEEQLRRQHLEKTVRTLQNRLLEYQQRLSVAIEVDRAKDAALANAQTEGKSLQQQLQQVRQAASKLEYEQQANSRKQENMQQELAQAVNMASKFQEKNDRLEMEVNNCSKKNNEITELYKKQVEQLEQKLHCSKTAEELALNDLSKLRDKLAKAEYQNEKLKARTDDLEKESSTLRHQKELLQDYHQKQKNRADALETQRKSLQESLGSLTENESNLKKKLEVQQRTLKAHYQQQLENVVAQKLREFQEQLDKMDEDLRSEARERERLIAERAVKQIELMNEKNELELNLLQEKHNEEVSLYRIQLANASKKIDELEFKLSAYKSKRADIAEKLHDVMETQWQKALEILTSPNQSRQIGAMTTDASQSSPDQPSKANGYHETPKKSKQQAGNTHEEQQVPPVDKLQAYIELLLSKSPSDFEKLDEILALTRTKSTAGKLDKLAKRANYGKPPWKA